LSIKNTNTQHKFTRRINCCIISLQAYDHNVWQGMSPSPIFFVAAILLLSQEQLQRNAKPTHQQRSCPSTAGSVFWKKVRQYVVNREWGNIRAGRRRRNHFRSLSG
jgi:hypothetical protein